jgi:predicted methyltransferase
MSQPSPQICSLPRRALIAAAAASPWSALKAQTEGDGLAEAVAAVHRSAANRARDPWRHPLETLRFFGLKREHAVIEVAPGAGWYTEILAPWLRDRGRLIAAHYARDDASEYRRRSRAVFDGFLAGRPDLYGKVVTVTMPESPRFTDLPAATTVDAIVTFRNVHNWLTDGHLDQTMRAFASVLKPGGILGVVDHRAPAGASLDWMTRSGYVSESFMESVAQAAGFRLQARSEINANPRDDKYHPNGVWSLPPSFRGGAVDRERYAAIGESDRFSHRYVRV